MAQVAAEFDPVSEVPLARRNGLDPDAVRALVRRLTGERDEAVTQGRQAHVELQRTKDSVLQLRTELDGAEVDAERALSDARAEAETILSDARAKGDEILREAAASAAAMSERAWEHLASMRTASQTVSERVRRAANDLRAQAEILEDSAVGLPADLDNDLLVGVEGSRVTVDPQGPLLAFGTQGEGRATGLLEGASESARGPSTGQEVLES